MFGARGFGELRLWSGGGGLVSVVAVTHTWPTCLLTCLCGTVTVHTYIVGVVPPKCCCVVLLLSQ